MKIGTAIAFSTPWIVALLFGVFVGPFVGGCVAFLAFLAPPLLADMEPRP